MFTTHDPTDPIHVLEALYERERPRDAWFKGVLSVAAAAFDRGAGVGFVLYDVSGDVPHIEASDGVNVSAEDLAFGAAIHARPEAARHIVRVYRTAVCATLEEHVQNRTLRRSMREHSRAGIRDQILVNGANQAGLGCALFVHSKEYLRLTGSERQQMTRIATHLSTAYRLFRRL